MQVIIDKIDQQNLLEIAIHGKRSYVGYVTLILQEHEQHIVACEQI
jgi:hypothetical protein